MDVGRLPSVDDVKTPAEGSGPTLVTTISGSTPGSWALRIGLALLTAVVPAIAQSFTDRHVIFDNSASVRGHFHSETHRVAPSELAAPDHRIPVDSTRWSSPPNSLRIRWRSAPGGDWRATLKIPSRYARKFRFEGDSLVLKIWSADALDAANTPRISLQDATGFSSPTINLIRDPRRLEPGRWTEVILPFAEFRLPFNSTDDRRFDPTQLVAVNLVQGLDDNRPHTVWIDDVHVRTPSDEDTTPPPVPEGLIVAASEAHFDLQWDPVMAPDLLHYRIERSDDGRNFRPVGLRPGSETRFVDFPPRPHAAIHYRVAAVDLAGNASAPCTGTASLRPPARLSDDSLLDLIQQGCFRYYWEQAHPEAGLAPEIVPGDPDLLATGGNGFGFIALTVAAERGFVSRAAAAERMLRAVRFLARADRFHGAWPHFLSPAGKAIAYFGPYDNGGDLVETAFVIQGLLVARQYFDRDTAIEREIRDTCTRLWREVEWDWYRKTPDSDLLYWHWSPDHAFHISHPLIGWNETLIVYLLAIASPTHPVPARLYHSGWAGTSPLHVAYRQGWSRSTDGDHYVNGNTYRGIRLEVGEGNGAELCFTHFSFLGFDPRGLRDRYTDYFQNNQAIARINHAYCAANPRRWAGYGPACWGLSAGIQAGGGRPLHRDDNGTINCMAALASMPYTPRESMAALRHFYRKLGPRIWGTSGLHDGFNASQDWYDEVYMALNQAPITVMIENHRTGLPWRRFMANPEIPTVLEAIGFRKVP